ncbi:hypothetical protein PV327_004140 [Microctonus hyperodae]|uniref:Uncharacterized protein n=1 Tax=Microctonus hyperodae TaxID=165561 RepID=A0AA39FBX8_MICHY|nr:hypothetical protein PV327_004140 [Microctonus hyperodae]
MDEIYIYDISGVISDIFSDNEAVIKFKKGGKDQSALIQKNNFYHNGRVIPKNERWDNYITVGMPVKFNAQKSNCAEYSYCDWCATMCWSCASNLLNKITIKSGFGHMSGQVIDINNRRGILNTFNATGQSLRTLFIAKNVYIDEQKFTGKLLQEVLDIHDYVSFDALPCISEGNDEVCEWFATIVYKGKRPNLVNSIMSIEEKTRLNDGLYKFWKSVYDSSIIKEDLNDPQLNFLNSDFKIQCYNFIQQHINNPDTLFVNGKGIIMDIVNDEFGVILGEFRNNLFQTIIFHRQNVFLNKVSLKTSNLAEILCPGDPIKFIAVGAPSGFLSDWIAVQICVTLNQLGELPM